MNTRVYGAQLLKLSPLFHGLWFCLISLVTSPATAELIDRGNGLIYDTVQDLTWMQNAQLFSGTWDSVKTQIENFVYAGFDDWRLPTTSRFDDPTCSADLRGELFYEHRIDCTGGEMEMLSYLYDPWNNDLFKYVDADGRVQRHINRTRYWASTPYRDGIDPCIHYPDYDVPCTLPGDNGDRTGFYWQWGFAHWGTFNGPGYKTTLSGGNGRYGWAVRDGDVIPSVLPGDMNFDDLVNVADYLLLMQFVLDPSSSPTPNELEAGDMNQNGQLDTGDLVIHARTILGSI